jgi:hypothetical protein
MLDSIHGGTMLESAPRPSETRVNSASQPRDSPVLDSSEFSQTVCHARTDVVHPITLGKRYELTKPRIELVDHE